MEQNEDFLDLGFVDFDSLNSFGGVVIDENQQQETIENETTNTNQDEEKVAEEKVVEQSAKQPTPESVGNEEVNQVEEEDSEDNSDGSPISYSSIAKALKESGVLQSLDDDYLDNIQSVEEFVDAFAKDNYNAQSDLNKRVLDALEAKMEPDTIQKYENMLYSLNSIKDDFLEDDSEQANNFRKNVIFQDYINKGYTKEKAIKLTERAINSEDVVDDAKDALASCKEFYNNQYQSEINKLKDAQKKEEDRIKQTSQELQDSIMKDDNVFKSLGVSEITRRKIVNSVSKPIKQKDGSYTTELNEYARKNPVDFYKYLGLFYTLTDGFTNIDTLISAPVQKKNKEALKSIEKALKANPRLTDGNPKITSGVSPLPSVVDWNNTDFTLADEE